MFTTSFAKNSWTVLLSAFCAVACCLPQAASAREMAFVGGIRKNVEKPDPYTEVPLETGDPNERNKERGGLVVNLNIPHKTPNNKTVCTVYPWPTMLPKALNPHVPLPLKTKAIKNLILQTGYTQKYLKRTAYPIGGWRWQEAYHRALERSGQWEPHTILSMYIFREALFPYCKEEIERSNEKEEERLERYKQADADYKELKADAETEALRKGLQPSPLNFNRISPKLMRQGAIRLLPGNYWIVCTHKVPGLTYYWQLPISIHEGEALETTLDEDNAILIDGAW